MGKKVWTPRNISENLLTDLTNLGYSKPLAFFLSARGITPEKLDFFFNPSLKKLRDPYEFPKIKEAVKKLWDAVIANATILVHGDYDADGVTATAIIASVLRENGGIVSTFLPDRFDDGYGFTEESLQKALDKTNGKCKVLITVDCGINSKETVEMANKLGIDVIITDHHEPDFNSIPNALALINPKLYPEMKDLHVLAGAGVSFKLAHAFVKYGRENNLGGFTTNLNDVLDITSLGTVADIVPLTDENRILVKQGLKILAKQVRPGIRALFENSNIKGPLTPSDITYRLAPKINAAGRLGNADIALKLLEAENIVEAYKYAEMLNNFNKERQATEQEIYNEAKAQIENSDILSTHSSIVVAGENWHQGVIGIVASRLVRDYNRPSIVLSIQNGEGRGSGRSLPNINLVTILTQCSKLLLRYGGHPMAVGVTLDKNNIDEFRDAFDKALKEKLIPSDLLNKIEFDGEISLYDLDRDYFDTFSSLAPFGQGNALPIFKINNLYTDKVLPAGEKHTRGVLSDNNGYKMDFIAFGKNINTMPNGDVWNVLATPTLNDFYNPPTPQLQLIDIQEGEWAQ